MRVPRTALGDGEERRDSVNPSASRRCLRDTRRLFGTLQTVSTFGEGLQEHVKEKLRLCHGEWTEGSESR